MFENHIARFTVTVLSEAVFNFQLKVFHHENTIGTPALMICSTHTRPYRPYLDTTGNYQRFGPM